MSKTVMFVHGAWLTPAAWDPFRSRYESQGYTCLTPAWPLEDRPIAALRRSPHPNLGRLTIGKIVDHHENLIRELPEPPLLIGHSLGGLVVQKLLDRGLGTAGVSIDPVAPAGVLPGLTALRSALPVLLTWRAPSRVVTMKFQEFALSFAHLLSRAEQRNAYDRFIVPTPGRLYYQIAFGVGTRVNFKNTERAPLLLIAGEQDRTIELSMVQATFRKYQHSSAVTAFKSFPDRTHLLIAAPGWQEIADYAMDWASRQERMSVSLGGTPERVTYGRRAASA